MSAIKESASKVSKVGRGVREQFHARVAFLALIATAGALFLAVSSSSSAHAAPTVYYSNSATNGVTYYTDGYNDFVYNEAFNSSNGGPEVEIKERHTNGTINYVYFGAGEIDICHGPVYSEDGCENISGGTISLTCYKETVAC